MQRHADHRAGADPGAGLAVDAGVGEGVVGHQDLVELDAEAGEAGAAAKPDPQCGLAVPATAV